MLSGGSGGRVGSAWYDLELRDEGFLGQVQRVGDQGAAGLKPAANAAGELEGALGKAGAAAQTQSGRFSAFGNIAQGAVMGVGMALGGMVAQFAIQAPAMALEKLGQSIELASNKAEAASKVNVLFGASTDVITRASETAAQTVAMSSGAYLNAAGNVGNLLTNFGIAKDRAADMSVSMIQLAADVGSFTNADPTEVIEAMGAALRGESEPIRRFGVSISEAAIAQKAVAMGAVDSVAAYGKLDFATQQRVKTEAVYQLILEQTKSAQGDLARTSDGLANSQRLAAARQEEAFTRLGEKIMPLAQKILPMIADGISAVVDWITDLIAAIEKWIKNNQPLIQQAQQIASLIGDVLTKYFEIFFSVVQKVAYVLGGLIGIIVDTIGAVVDLGGVIVNVFAGKWDEAAKHGEQALTRLQGVQANVQRVLLDGGRMAADQQAAMLNEQQVTQNEAYNNMNDRNREMYAALVAGTQEGTAAVAGATADGLAAIPEVFKQATEPSQAVVDKMLQQMADATGVSLAEMTALWKQSGVDISTLAGKTAKDAADAVKAGAEAAVNAAAWGGEQTPGAWSDGVRSEFDQVTSAMSDLKDLMKNTLSPAQKEAELIGIATSKRLAKALQDGRPEVQGEAQQIALDTIDQLHKLDSKSPEIGRLTTKLLASALPEQRPALQHAIDLILGDVTGPLGTLPGIAADAGDDITAALARRLYHGAPVVNTAAKYVARQVSNVLQIESPAKEGPWSRGGGPIAWAEKVGSGIPDTLARLLYAGGAAVGAAAEYVAGQVDDAFAPARGSALDTLLNGSLATTTPSVEVRHVVEFDGKNLPAGVTNEGVAGVLGQVLDFDQAWAQKMAAAQAASGLRWVR